MTESLLLNAASIQRIGATAVDGLPVEIPRYPRQLRRRICHIGLGGFHRAHQAWYLHRLLQDGQAEGWGICGIGLRPADQALHQALHAQDGLYSLWETGGGARRVSVIGSIMNHVDASADSAAAVAAIADAATRIVSLTVTEAGYCLGADGALDLANADIVHDLAAPKALRSAPGLLVRGLAARRKAGTAAPTLLSCDNLIANGERLRAAVLSFAERSDPALARWIEAEVRFPCSMVDRITPVMSPQKRDALCAEWGVRDQAPVLCEDWRQWILEDGFAGERPPFERAGAVISSQVGLYEEMKVGLLNGSHSALSHLGLMAGFVRVHEALAEPLAQRWLLAYMGEVAQTLEPPPGVDLKDYQASLLRRYLNPAIEDRLARLAQDSSAKFQQVLLPPLLKRMDAGQPFRLLAAAIALWLAWLKTLSADPAKAADYLDVRKAELLALAAEADPSALLAAALPLPPRHAAVFRAEVAAQLAGILAAGPLPYLRKLL